MRICTYCQPVCYKTVGLRSPAVKSNQITAVNHNESKMKWTRYKINQLNIINYDPIGHSAAMAFSFPVLGNTNIAEPDKNIRNACCSLNKNKSLPRVERWYSSCMKRQGL